MNITDAQDSILQAKYELADWLSEFKSRWHEPETVMIEAVWQRIPEADKQVIMQNVDPALRKVLEGLSDGTSVMD